MTTIRLSSQSHEELGKLLILARLRFEHETVGLGCSSSVLDLQSFKELTLIAKECYIRNIDITTGETL